MVTDTQLIMAMTKMTNAEQFVIQLIVGKWYPFISTGQVEVLTTKLSKSDKAKVTEGTKLLIKKEIIKRVKRSNFMINPKLLQPRDTELAKETWEQL